MPSRKDCIDEILAAAGGRKTRGQVESELEGLDDRAQDYQKQGYGPGEAYQRAADEKIRRISEQAALARKQERENAAKAISLNRWLDQRRTTDKIESHVALEAKLVGVNTPFYKSQDSIAARWKAFADKWMGSAGFDGAFKRAGLDKLVASHAMEDQWGRELRELELGKAGQPGITKNPQALEIAKIWHDFDKQAITDHNRAGGWIRSYAGHVIKTTWDPDAIRFASMGGKKRPLFGTWGKGGQDADKLSFVADMLDAIDLPRVFGRMPLNEMRDALGETWAAFMHGDHFDYGAPSDDPIYSNVGAKAAAHREFHFKDYDAQKRIFDKYSLFNNITEAKVRSYDTLARQTALIQELGTKPAETFANAITYLKKQTFGTLERNTLDKWGEQKPGERTGPLWNRFNQLDGSNNRPVNKLAAKVTANWMVWERISMLGRVLFTHIAGLPAKSSEIRYWGAGLKDQYGGYFSHMVEGGEDRKELNQALWTGADSSISGMVLPYDVADSPSGALSRIQDVFFRYSGNVSRVLENQRNGSEEVMSRLLGMKRGQDYAELGPERSRILKMFGIEGPEWKALNQVDWTEGRTGTHLTPSDALKLSDDQVKSYLADRPVQFQGALGITDQMVDKSRQDLAMSLATMYGERGRYAMFLPSVKGKAILFRGTQAGTPENLALRLLWQFKQWPMEIMLKTWGRMIYGESGLKGAAGSAVHFVVASAIMGTFSEMARDATKGINPVAELDTHPFNYVMKGLLRSGAGTIAGDFLLGQYDRHGYSGLASFAGPTFGKFDEILDLIHGGSSDDHHPWKRRGADAVGMIRDNTPLVNMWWTSWAFEYLVLHELQEAINPGYIDRREKAMKQQQGTEFLLSPTQVHRALH